MGFRVGGGGHEVPIVCDFKPLRDSLVVVVDKKE